MKRCVNVSFSCARSRIIIITNNKQRERELREMNFEPFACDNYENRVAAGILTGAEIYYHVHSRRRAVYKAFTYVVYKYMIATLK